MLFNATSRHLRRSSYYLPVAIIFGLAVNFGKNTKAANQASDFIQSKHSIKVRNATLPIDPPDISNIKDAGNNQYIQFNVYPQGITYGSPGPELPFPIKDVTNTELSKIGEQLYDILRGFNGYQAAIVNWDPEILVDVTDLKNDWAPDNTIYKLHGLVLSKNLTEQMNLDSRFTAFSDEFKWLPYQGSQNI